MGSFRKYRDAQYMAELFIKLIEDVGVEFSVQTVTDNIPVCMHVEANIHRYCRHFTFFIL